MMKASVLTKVLSPVAVLLWTVILFVPIIFPYMSAVEGRLLPVSQNLIVTEWEMTSPDEVKFSGSLIKSRDCGHIETQYYNKAGKRLGFRFVRRSGWKTTTLATGFHPVGPIWISGVSHIKDVGEIITYHNCHPLWETKTVTKLQIKTGG